MTFGLVCTEYSVTRTTRVGYQQLINAPCQNHICMRHGQCAASSCSYSETWKCWAISRHSADYGVKCKDTFPFCMRFRWQYAIIKGYQLVSAKLKISTFNVSRAMNPISKQWINTNVNCYRMGIIDFRKIGGVPCLIQFQDIWTKCARLVLWLHTAMFVGWMATKKKFRYVIKKNCLTGGRKCLVYL